MQRKHARWLAVLGSTWALGLLVAVMSWTVKFQPPFPGLDPSWWAGLYMAAHRGFHFGTQIIFTYGPLGFLGVPWLWYGNLAVLAFLYQAALHVALCVSLIWALRRALSPLVALLVTFAVLVTAPSLDVPVVLAAIWCVMALSGSAGQFGWWLLVIGGAVLGATETLIELRPGPVVLAMCAVALALGPRWRRDLPLFLVVAASTATVLWIATGQGLGHLPSFVANSAQIISGYSEAMGIQQSSQLYQIGALLLGIVLLAGAALTPLKGRARWAAVAVVGLASFSLFKEAAVRAQLGHAAIFFSSAAGLAVALTPARRRLVTLAALTAITAVNVVIAHVDHQHLSFNPVRYAHRAETQVRLLFDPTRRAVDTYFYFLVRMQQQYGIPPGMQRLLKGHTVHIDPWEAGAAWAYGLRWDPLPVLQDYSAYTSKLDELDAAALRSRAAPQRILRENPALVDPQYQTATIDGRFPAWDPPAKSLAMLCNYAALQTNRRWQVLGKVSDHCAAPKLIRSISTRYGATVDVPLASAGTLVFAKVRGAGVSGLERIRTFLYRARFRYMTVNGGRSYRLVPGTTADGLLLDCAPGVDFPAPFALSPHASEIRLTGASGSLRVELYSMQARS